ncbi:MAG: GAF domain-containing protein [Terriglobales bacterium]
MPARARLTIEQLLLPRPAVATSGNLAEWREQVQYSAERLAKWGVPLAQIHAAFAVFRPLAVARLRHCLDAPLAAATQDWFQQQTQLAIAEAYVAAQSGAVNTLLAVLDVELSAANLHQLLERLLLQAAQLFPIRWGEILLVDERGPHLRLRHAATYGLGPDMIMDRAGAGAFFREVVRSGEPGFLLDAANDPRVTQPYYRELEVKSVWAVPLRRGPETLGILTVAFDRAYECLPKEKDLLLALAERSSLAIERTRMHDRLQSEQQRVLELSRRLLEAHDEERRRISRDLHDETGQALLALRLYLEMGLHPRSAAESRQWLRKGLALVDTSVDELRRILAQLSPLVLDELGLEAALRQELRRLRTQQHWRTRFRCALGGAALERHQQILLYRVVLEGLHNVARHARARSVQLCLGARDGVVQVLLSDDGVGLPPTRRPNSGFGIAGMRERIRLVGGSFQLRSGPNQGVKIAIQIPLNGTHNPSL